MTSSSVAHTTRLSVSYPSGDVARLVYTSISQETGQIPGDRTTASINRDGRTVAVDLEAADLTALRAGIHTWCTLVQTAEDTLEGLA